MRHYRITKDLQHEVNEFLGLNYLKPKDIGRDFYHLENYEKIARVSPKKAKLLMATLFPEELKSAKYMRLHKKEIKRLAKKFHMEKGLPPAFSWTDYMVRKETLPYSFESLSDEDIFKGNILRFR